MVYYHGGGDMTAIPERCIAYKEFIEENCLGYVDKPEDMIKMYKAMKEYYLTKLVVGMI